MERFDTRIMDGFPGQRMFVLVPDAYSPYMKHPLISRMYLTDAGYFPRAAHHYIERHEARREYILLFCTAGRGSVRLDGKTVSLRENEAFCIPSGAAHSYWADAKDPWSLLWVHFAGSDTEMFPLREEKVIRFEPEGALDRLAALFGLLFRVLEADYSLGNFIYISQVLMLILAETYYREKDSGRSGENRHVTQMIRFMHTALDRRVSLDDLAGEFSLSKSYIHAAFRNCTGRSPMAFLNALRLRRACELLRSSTLPVQEIACRVGFADPLYFSRAFRRHVGLSPSAYRSSQRFE